MFPCRPNPALFLLTLLALVQSGCTLVSSFPEIPPASYQVNRSINVVNEHLLTHAYQSWRKPNLTWSEDPITVITESWEHGSTRVIRVKRDPPDIRLPHFVELKLTHISPDSTRIVVRYNRDGYCDAASYFADTRTWLEEIGAMPDAINAPPLVVAEYINQRQSDSAILLGDIANFVRFSTSGEAHTGVKGVDGVPVKLGTGKVFASPGRHKIAVSMGAKGFRAEDVVEVELLPMHTCRFTGIALNQRGKLTLWDETGGTKMKLQSWELAGQQEL